MATATKATERAHTITARPYASLCMATLYTLGRAMAIPVAQTTKKRSRNAPRLWLEIM
jgi:hypothetical protein